MNISVRYLSKVAAPANIKKSVFISQSNDIFTNLALEDWLYRNYDFTNHNILMLWSNDPCVVIGRYQNPWLEANISDLPYITNKGVQLARRNSGGGTVYQDRGNLNLTFFTSKQRYNRKLNLELISRAIFQEYGVNIDLSPRDDLVIRNCKISGTAAKLGRLNAYHHCTLLVDVNKSNLSRALQKECSEIKTNATKSIRSKILNLCDQDPKITIEGLFSAIGQEYLNVTHDTNFELIDPSDVAFPDLSKIREDLCDWTWRFGKTPKFTVTKSFLVPNKFLNKDVSNPELGVVITVENGNISEVTLNDSLGLFSEEVQIINGLKNFRFTQDAIDSFIQSLLEDKNKFVTDCIKQVMTSI